MFLKGIMLLLLGAVCYIMLRKLIHAVALSESGSLPDQPGLYTRSTISGNQTGSVCGGYQPTASYIRNA